MPKSPAKATKSKRASRATKRSAKYGAIRTVLERQRANLIEEASQTFSHRPENGAMPDVSDQATVEFDQTFTLRLKEREQKLLKKIDEALDRIATETYGICERCGDDIPYKRLKARPVTTLCIECKTLQEEEENLRR